MPQRIAVAVLTEGGAAHLSDYFPALAEAEEVESVSLADPSGQSEAAARAALGGKLTRVYRDYGELLRREEPVMALVTTEAVHAPPIIDRAMDAGCHVLAEKPSCVDPADFAGLVRKADSKHLHLMLAFANRVRPQVIEARRMIAAGTFGKIYGVEVHIIADQTRLMRPDYLRSWLTHKDRAGGGNLIWLGIHWIDLLMYLTGLSIEEVSAFAGNVGGQPIDTEDSAAVVMRLENGCYGTLTSGYYLDKGYHSHVKIWGSKGWLLLEPHSDDSFVWQIAGDPQHPEIQHYAGPVTPAGYTPFVRVVARACAGLAEPPISNAESLHALRTVFACYRAGETGQRQRVK